jgi:F-type H+-transporting ATPase subunit a
MDPHSSWLVLVPGYESLVATLQNNLIFGDASMVVAQHLVGAMLVVIFLLVGTSMSSRHFRSTPVSAKTFGFILIFDAILGGVAGMCRDLIGTSEWKRYFPLIATLALFILFSNLMGLVPGFAPPTDNLETTAVCAVIVFLYYNFHSLRRNGIGHIAHMANPAGMGWTWALAPLMFPIELIGHLARPLSLALRLRGNMVGDHAVIAAFAGILPIVLPLPFLVMGLLVCCLQAYVFCMLSAIYIGMGVEQHEDH